MNIVVEYSKPKKKNCNKYSEKKTDWKFFVEYNEQGIMKKKNEQKKNKAYSFRVDLLASNWEWWENICSSFSFQLSILTSRIPSVYVWMLDLNKYVYNKCRFLFPQFISQSQCFAIMLSFSNAHHHHHHHRSALSLTLFRYAIFNRRLKHSFYLFWWY